MKRPFFAALLAVALLPSVAFSQEALQRLEELLRKANPNLPLPAERVEPGYLGAIADDRDENGRGVRVMKVAEGGPAAQGGLRERDLVTAIDGRPIRKMDDVARHLEATTAGARMVFDVERDGRGLRLPITLGARPAANGRLFQDFGKIQDPAQQPGEQLPPPDPRDPREAAPLRGPLLGVRSATIAVEDQIRLRLPIAQGARITEVNPGSPAERAGLRINDFVTSVDGQLVRLPADLSQRVAQAGAGKTVELGLYRGGQFFQIRVRLGDDGREPIPAPQQQEVQRPPLDPRRLDDKARIEMLEQAVGDLMQRVQQLEAELEKARPAPQKPIPNRGAEVPPPEPGT